jgi:RNA polymerase sigma-70 factor (ECF subfamily)
MATTKQTAMPVTEANGVLDAGTVLVRAFNEMRDELLSTLLFVLGNRDDAQDAAQEGFVKCWGARDQVPEVINLRAWIFRICFNTAKDMRRSAWKRHTRPLLGEETMPAINQLSPGQTLEFKESVQRLRKAILGLRQEEKEVFLLRQNGELTYEQIAELHRVPVGTVKTRMRSALENLRKLFAEG